jgi:hypothetical protein
VASVHGARAPSVSPRQAQIKIIYYYGKRKAQFQNQETSRWQFINFAALMVEYTPTIFIVFSFTALVTSVADPDPMDPYL